MIGERIVEQRHGAPVRNRGRRGMPPPIFERLPFPDRKGAPPVDSEIPLVEPAARGSRIQPVRYRRDPARPFRDPVDPAKRPNPQRRAVPLPISREKLTLEP